MKIIMCVCVIGGGVVGCFVFYYLIKFGWFDVMLVECLELIFGFIWYVVGGFYMFNGDINMVVLQGYIIKFYKEFEEIIGMFCGLYYVGGVMLVDNQDCFDMLVVEWVKYWFMGLEIEIVGFEEIKKIVFVINIDGIIGVFYDFLDGYFDLLGIIYVYVKVVCMGGVMIEIYIKVLEINQCVDGIWDVVINKGMIYVEYIVNVGGFWVCEVGVMVGIYFLFYLMEY